MHLGDLGGESDAEVDGAAAADGPDNGADVVLADLPRGGGDRERKLAEADLIAHIDNSATTHGRVAVAMLRQRHYGGGCGSAAGPELREDAPELKLLRGVVLPELILLEELQLLQVHHRGVCIDLKALFAAFAVSWRGGGGGGVAVRLCSRGDHAGHEEGQARGGEEVDVRCDEGRRAERVD